MTCIEDLIHEIATCGPDFREQTTSCGHSSSHLLLVASSSRDTHLLKDMVHTETERTSSTLSSKECCEPPDQPFPMRIGSMKLLRRLRLLNELRSPIARLFKLKQSQL